jgi:ATP-binding cassette, subfamily B, multidrug efflux pump
MWRGIQGMAELPDERASQGRQVATRLWQYLAPFKAQLAIILLLALVSAGSQAVAPVLIGQAIDQAISRNNSGLLNTLMFGLFAVFLAGAAASRFQFMWMGEIGQRTLTKLRTEIFAAIQRLSLSFFDRQPAGDLMSRLVNDTDVLNQLLGQGLIQILGSLFGLVGILIAMLALNWQLALLSFIIIPIMLLATSVFSRMARGAFRKTRESLGDVSAEIQEEIAGVKVAQAFTRTNANQERFARRNAVNRDANVSATAITSAFTPVIDLLATIATAVVAAYGGILAINGEISVGTMIAFLTYVQIFFRPVQALASFYTTAQAALAAAERIFSLVDTVPEITDTATAKILPAIHGAIEFDHVSFSYGARQGSGISSQEPGNSDQRSGVGVPANGSATNSPLPRTQPSLNKPQAVLRDVSLTVQPGQTIAIVGPTGAGKTTLVNLIGRFYDVSDGAVRVDGYDLREVTRASLRSQMGVVLQDSFLFAGTIHDNIRYGKIDATEEQITAAAQAANAHEFILRLPDGYQTVVGERGGGLSQGQRQLIGIARAILADPRILILDEATSSVDTRTEALIQQALRTLLRGRTSFVIAHRLSTIREADMVLVLEAGQIVERGTHDELLAHDGLYAELYRRQFRDVPAVGAV